VKSLVRKSWLEHILHKTNIGSLDPWLALQA